MLIRGRNENSWFQFLSNENEELRCCIFHWSANECFPYQKWLTYAHLQYTPRTFITVRALSHFALVWFLSALYKSSPLHTHTNRRTLSDEDMRLLVYRSLRPQGKFNEVWSESHIFSFKTMHLKISSAKWRPFCLIFNVLSRKLNAKSPSIYNVSYTLFVDPA